MKKFSIDQLAIFGGEPAFARKLHVGYPNFGNRDRFLQRVNQILDERRFTNNGPFVRELEERIARMIGVRHCIAMANGTIALEITIRALGLQGEVIVPSLTFIATAHALQWQQITPVFCDVNPQDYTIDPDRVEELITPRTTGIIGVHLWAHPCQVERLTAIARKHGLKLLFDAAHAFGCTANGKMIGNFGDAEVFSFHATKFFSTFEGGAVVTNNDELAEKIRLMRNFGFAGRDNVIYIGTNGKMNELSAAMGLTSLESIDSFIQRNYQNYRIYREILEEIPGLRFLRYNEQEKSNYQYIVVEVDETVTGISRNLLVNILEAENVLARRYFYPGCHRMEPYRSYFPHAGLLLPETERIVQRVMTLPTGAGVEEEDIHTIGQIIRLSIDNAAEIRKRLKATPAIHSFPKTEKQPSMDIGLLYHPEKIVEKEIA